MTGVPTDSCSIGGVSGTLAGSEIPDAASAAGIGSGLDFSALEASASTSVLLDFFLNQLRNGIYSLGHVLRCFARRKVGRLSAQSRRQCSFWRSKICIFNEEFKTKATHKGAGR